MPTLFRGGQDTGLVVNTTEHLGQGEVNYEGSAIGLTFKSESIFWECTIRQSAGLISNPPDAQDWQ